MSEAPNGASQREDAIPMSTMTLPFTDTLGRRNVLLVREPEAGLEAFVVVDNVACGPAIGGVRMPSHMTLEEVARLARAMTLKNAAAGLPHRGAKAGIVANPVTTEKERPREAAEVLARARVIEAQGYRRK